MKMQASKFYARLRGWGCITQRVSYGSSCNWRLYIESICFHYQFLVLFLLAMLLLCNPTQQERVGERAAAATANYNPFNRFNQITCEHHKNQSFNRINNIRIPARCILYREHIWMRAAWLLFCGHFNSCRL